MSINLIVFVQLTGHKSQNLFVWLWIKVQKNNVNFKRNDEIYQVISCKEYVKKAADLL